MSTTSGLDLVPGPAHGHLRDGGYPHSFLRQLPQLQSLPGVRREIGVGLGSSPFSRGHLMVRVS